MIREIIETLAGWMIDAFLALLGFERPGWTSLAEWYATIAMMEE